MLLQTLHAEHPMLQTLINSDYLAFARQEMNLRRAAVLPPFAYHALVRGEATRAGWADQFLREISAQTRSQYPIPAGVQIIGPFPAPMEKRGGLYRAQLLLSARTRSPLHGLLAALIEQAQQHPQGRRVRWTVDVDPLDNY